MTKRMTMLIVALSGFGVAVGGCGDDENAATTAATTTTTAAPAEAPAGATATEPDTSSSPAASGVPDTPEAKQAIVACKALAATNPQLSAKAKDKIGEICDKAGSGDADGAAKASREACEAIVEDTAPAGAAKDTALAACKQPTATP